MVFFNWLLNPNGQLGNQADQQEDYLRNSSRDELRKLLSDQDIKVRILIKALERQSKRAIRDQKQTQKQLTSALSKSQIEYAQVIASKIAFMKRSALRSYTLSVKLQIVKEMISNAINSSEISEDLSNILQVVEHMQPEDIDIPKLEAQLAGIDKEWNSIDQALEPKLQEVSSDASEIFNYSLEASALDKFQDVWEGHDSEISSKDLSINTVGKTRG